MDAPHRGLSGRPRVRRGRPAELEAQRALCGVRRAAGDGLSRQDRARAGRRDRAARARGGRRAPSTSVHWFGETSRIHDLLACADVVAPAVGGSVREDGLSARAARGHVARAASARGARQCCRGAVRRATLRVAVEPHADALAHELERLLVDPARRAASGRTAVREVHERYTYRSMAAAYEAVYDRLLAVIGLRAAQARSYVAPLMAVHDSNNRTYYDDFSTSYERERAAGYHPLIDEIEVDAVRELAAGKRVLEAGCGTGLVLSRLVAASRARPTASTSRSAWCRRRARADCRSRSAASRRCRSATTASISCAASRCSRTCRTSRVALAELARVTRPGGTLGARVLQPVEPALLGQAHRGPGQDQRGSNGGRRVHALG